LFKNTRIQYPESRIQENVKNLLNAGYWILGSEYTMEAQRWHEVELATS
jgi:hypothetical protein